MSTNNCKKVSSTSDIATNSEDSGETTNEKPTTERKMGFGCDTTCRFKCQSKISFQERSELFAELWALKGRAEQWYYLDKMVDTHETKEPTSELKKTNSKNEKTRTISRHYYFNLPTRKVKVCQTMFLQTYGISKVWIETIRKKKKLSGDSDTFQGDMRGKHSNKPKRIPKAVTDSVHNHITEFIRDEFHNHKQITTREMYRRYKQWALENKFPEIATEHHYRDICNSSYSNCFHRTKKKRSNIGSVATNTDEKQSEEMEIKMTPYERNVAMVRESMRLDIAEAKQNSSICCASFDLQKVLKSEISVMYHEKKLIMYSFTILNLADKKGYCNIWNETISKAGANEVSSCLWNFIVENKRLGVTEFRFYSDNCTDKKQNHILFSMYAKASSDLTVTIIHRYLLKHHPQSDGKSSMDSAVESEFENLFINICIKKAKLEGPEYSVHQMHNSEFFDFSILPEINFWSKIDISLLSEIKIYPHKEIEFRYSHEDEMERMLISIDENQGDQISIDENSSTDNFPLNIKMDPEYIIGDKDIPNEDVKSPMPGHFLEGYIF